MKTTGIVRRVDDLGRIVIPREYRRAYDIDIGDPMEISADENGVISLKRVDVGADFKRAAETVTAFLAEKFGWTALACDKRKILCACGKKHGVFDGKDINRRLIEALEAYKTAAVSPSEMFGEAAEEFSWGYVVPVLSDRAAEGALVVMSEDEISDSEKHVAELCARLIANNMQKY